MATRIIEINWTPAEEVSVIGYNIYIVNGAPAGQTKQFLVFVAGRTSDQYLYNGEEGTQYEFEIRATNGDVESPPLEVFYPNGTSLYTPTLLTPTGEPMLLPRDTQYLSKEEFITFPTGLKIRVTDLLYTSGALDTILQMASEEVNRFCRCHFDVQTIDEIHDGVRISPDYPKMIYIPTDEGPIQNIIRIDLQVLQWFINFSLQYLQIMPDKRYIQIVPFLGGSTSGIPLPAAVLTEGILAKMWIRYTFGYDAMPATVKMATALYAAHLIGIQENPLGAASVKFGKQFSLDFDESKDPVMARIRHMLEPYRTGTWRRP